VSFNIERLNESSNVFLHRVFQNQFMQIWCLCKSL
jgi:hypothetical protein